MASGAEEPNALVGLGQGGRFEPNQRTTTTAYVFGVVPYLQHDEFGTRLDWRGVCLGGVSTAVFSLLLVRVPRKRKDPGEVGRA